MVDQSCRVSWVWHLFGTLKTLSHCNAELFTILNIFDWCLFMYMVYPWNTLTVYVVPNQLSIFSPSEELANLV